MVTQIRAHEKRAPLIFVRRTGHRAALRVEFGKARCRLHGGLSTGPKTEAGRARIAEAQRRRWRDYRERRLRTSLAEAPIVKA
jgi:hypothetical protein